MHHDCTVLLPAELLSEGFGISSFMCTHIHTYVRTYVCSVLILWCICIRVRISQVSGFKQYVDMYLKVDGVDDDAASDVRKVVYEKVNPRWEVCVTVSNNGFQQASFVNSIATTKVSTECTYVHVCIGHVLCMYVRTYVYLCMKYSKSCTYVCT